MQKRLLFFVVLLLTSTMTVVAQVTTASLSGRVSSEGESVIGATIQAVHVESGTHYGAITNMDGLYTIQGMRTGVYSVEISYVGYATIKFKDVLLRLGENFSLNANLKESSELMNEVVVVGSSSKFNNVKTGASTNISNKQLTLLPSINRSLSDFTRLSPYSGANNSLSGRDGRTNSFTIDGANLNNNFGLSNDLPGGGNPISLDAIEEVQVVVAPFDVRQTNFVGGGINAITKSGTNIFKGSAYTYQRNQHLRGNSVDGYDLGTRSKESKETYGFTIGGPIIKNKLFFFVNGEYENAPSPITKWKLSTDGVANADQMISRITAADMKAFSDILSSKYGYNAGSYDNYDGGTKNYKLLARIDWNISDQHKFSVRFNTTKNSQDISTNGTSTVGTKASSNRISKDAFSFRNACYSMDNKVWSLTAELNSRFNNDLSNRLLFTYSNIQDIRSTDSSPFPFIDIWDGSGNAFMSAGYELFSWNNAVKNKVINVQDNIIYSVGKHKIIGGLSYEYQKALNSFMRFGTGYYKYASFSDFQNGAAPIAFGLTYGYNGQTNPAAEVSFGQSGLYLQDEWNINDNFKFTYGIRADLMNFLTDLETNEAYKALDWTKHFYGANESGKSPSIDTGKWPDANILFSPRIGFNWDIKGDKSLILRGGSGIFTGRIPLVFFTNMPTNAMMLQNTVSITNASDLAKLKGGLITDVNSMISTLGLPTTSLYGNASTPVKSATVVGIANDFKLPQVWKNSLAIDYTIPVSFPMTLTVEGMINKEINAIKMENYNVLHNSYLSKFAGPDQRLNYAKTSVQSGVTGGAIVLKNSSKGYSSTINAMVTAEPIKDLNLMLSYTHTISQEITGLPGSQAYSSWQNSYNVNGVNNNGLSRSQYVTPNKVIASASYRINYAKNFATSVGLYYAGYNAGTYNYYYSNDMNGDGATNDLLYIPSTKDQIKFVDANGFTAAQQAEAFWKFVEQDKYLNNHKGEYAKAYGATMPWVNRVDLKLAQDFKIKVGNAMNTLQFTVDILNIGNLINDSWGVTKSTSSCNYGKLLQYKGVDSDNVPTFSMGYNTINNQKVLYDKTFETYKDSSNCWQLQFGIRYIFN